MCIVDRLDAFAGQSGAGRKQFGVMKMNQRRRQFDRAANGTPAERQHAIETTSGATDIVNRNSLDVVVAPAIRHDQMNIIARIADSPTFLEKNADVTARVHAGQMDYTRRTDHGVR